MEMTFPTVPAQQDGQKPDDIKVGDKVAGMYFKGTLSSIQPSDTGDLYTMQIEDADPRINGLFTSTQSHEIMAGETPRYLYEYNSAIASNPADKTITPSYGEILVGLSEDLSGIDAIQDVAKLKKIFANLIDELTFQLRTREKELIIATIKPTNKLAASTAVINLYKDLINRVVEFKFLAVSAAVGNNDRA